MNVQININKSAGNSYTPESDSSAVSALSKRAHLEEQRESAVAITELSGKNMNEDSDAPEVCSMDKFSFEKDMVDMFTSFINSFKEMMQQYMSQIKDMVSSLVESFKGLVPSPATKPATTETPVSRQMESFAVRMPKILSAHASIGHINEADLQAGVIAYQLYQKNEAAEQFFLKKLSEQDRNNMSQGEAIKAALIATQEAGKISKLEAEFVFKLSHRASQVDENHNEVSESPHGAGTMNLEHAIKTAEIALAKIIQGHIMLEPRPLY